MSENASFYVVLQGIGSDKGGNYKGVRTLLEYDNRDIFDRIMKSDAAFVDTIVYAGPSEQKARRLAAKTTGEARAEALLEMIKKNPAIKRTLFFNQFAVSRMEGQEAEFLIRLSELGFIIEEEIGND